jgi:hypothetical protein
MIYRHELKFFMNARTSALLKCRVSAIMPPDTAGGADGIYTVNNLYIDDTHTSSYYEKIGGSYGRNKYRVRFYNNDLSFIRFENKRKDGELSYKKSVAMTGEEYRSIARGDMSFVLGSDNPLWQKVAVLHRTRGMRPTAAFSYLREAYLYRPGNVRITFDSNIRQDKLAPEPDMRAPPGNGGMLEVKYDCFLPDVIRGLLHGLPLARTEMSKYCYSMERGFIQCLHR